MKRKQIKTVFNVNEKYCMKKRYENNENENSIKHRIVIIAEMVLSNPEKYLSLVEEIHQIMISHENPSLQHIALLSQVEIFKELIPGYRIKQMSEEMKKTMISKQVAGLWHFEQSLLTNYSALLKVLFSYISILLQKHKKQNSNRELYLASVKSLGYLLESGSHFNYSSQIISKLATISLSNDNEAATIACSSLERIFCSTYLDETCLSIIRHIHRISNKHPEKIRPQIISTFLFLSFSALSQTGFDSEKEISKKKSKKSKGKEGLPSHPIFLEKSTTDWKKFGTQIQKDLDEANAEVMILDRHQTQSKILEFIFKIYLRILRYKNYDCLSAVLTGISKLSHLVNIELVYSILKFLDNIISDQQTSYSCALYCVNTTFEIMKGFGDSLVIDLKHIYTTVFNLIPLSILSYNISNFNIFTKCLENMFIKHRQLSLDITASYVKRIGEILVQLYGSEATDLCSILMKIFQKYPKTQQLLQEPIASGVFRPDSTNPELSQPFSEPAWLIVLAQRSFNSEIANQFKKMINTDKEWIQTDSKEGMCQITQL